MTRIVTGTIRTPSGDPWPDFQLVFRLTPSTSTLEATYPEQGVTVTTSPDGTFAQELVEELEYRVELTSAFVHRGTAIQYPPGSSFTIVVPEGEGPISLEAVRALGHPVPPSTPELLDSVVAAIEARLIPAGGVTGQALVKASDDGYALMWGTADAHYSGG